MSGTSGGFTGSGNSKQLTESTVFASLYGATGDGVTNDTAALTQAASLAGSQAKWLRMRSGGIYVVDNFNFLAATKLLGIIGCGCTFIHSGAAQPSSRAIFNLENLHGQISSQFIADDFLIDCNNTIDHGILVHGGTGITFRNFDVIRGKSHNIVLKAEENFGIYNLRMDNFTSTYADGRGLHMSTEGGAGSTRFHANKFDNFRIQHCLSDGVYMNYGSATMDNGRIELNNGAALQLDNVRALEYSGGYFENNNQNKARGGTPNANEDTIAEFTANTSGVSISGTRDIGIVNDALADAAGNTNFLMLRTAKTMGVNAAGDLTTGAVRVRADGCYIIGTGAKVPNSLVVNDGFQIRVAGLNAMRFNNTGEASKSFVEIRYRIAADDANLFHKLILEDLGAAAQLANKANLVGGKIPESEMPPIALAEYKDPVANEAAMLALTAEQGDFTYRTDTNTVWMMSGTDATQLTDWLEFPDTGGGGSGDFKADGTIAMTGPLATDDGNLQSNITDVAGNIGFDFNTASSLTQANTKIARFKNNDVAHFALGADGQIFAYTLPIAKPVGAGSIWLNNGLLTVGDAPKATLADLIAGTSGAVYITPDVFKAYIDTLAAVEDDAYAASWENDPDAPSKGAMYTKIEEITAAANAGGLVLLHSANRWRMLDTVGGENTWVSNADKNFGENVQDGDEFGGTGIDPVPVSQYFMGRYLKAGSRINDIIIAGRGDTNQITDVDIRAKLYTPKSTPGWTGGISALSDYDELEIFKNNWHNPTVGAGAAFTGAFNEGHGRTFTIDHTVAADSYYVVWMKAAGTITGGTKNVHLGVTSEVFWKV